VVKSRIKNRTDVLSTDASSTYGCTKPSRSFVVSGERSFGSRPMKSAATLIELTICPCANPGCVLRPWNVTTMESAEKVSDSMSPRVLPSIVYAYFAPNFFTSKCIVPLPTSSSGVKPMRIVPCGISGCWIRYSAAAMISATPALLSAPSSVVPDAVTMSLPICSSRSGLSARRITAVGSSGSTMSCPFQLRCTIGFTFSPLISGEVSTWARKPMTGTFGFLVVAGIVAMTWPCSSRTASVMPIALSSFTRSSSSTSCLSVLGYVSEPAADCVSYVT
jgi:hypothetical protein